jgi:hypothetical protein
MRHKQSVKRLTVADGGKYHSVDAVDGELLRCCFGRQLVGLRNCLQQAAVGGVELL